MSKTIACCDDEPAPDSIFDVQPGRPQREGSSGPPSSRQTHIRAGTAGPDHAFGPPRQQLEQAAAGLAGDVRLPGAPGGLIIRAQPACKRPTAAFSIVGSSSRTAFAAGPSGIKLSSLVTRVIRPA